MLHLDHTIVLTHDQDKSARFIARMFGLTFEGRWDEEFDAILGRVKSEGIPFGSGPRIVDDMEINHKHQGRGFYFRDAHDGHSWEVITHTYV
jgi:catechol 2,3-dioxygenase-like lactoylglutathione lyase family enzyme